MKKNGDKNWDVDMGWGYVHGWVVVNLLSLSCL